MSEYYNPNRSPAWNYGGNNWKLSRSKIDLFLSCPRCFYLDNKLGTSRPKGFPFNLNSAVDKLLKLEFDIHRANGTQHPLMAKYKIDAIPVAHEDLEKWRHNFTGIQYFHKPTGITVSGAIDDLWQNSKGEYIVVDYKATSKDEEILALDKDWQIGYKRQMEIYQWLLRQNGYKVSSTGYFVYCNGQTDREAFDGKLEFDITLISYVGDDSWVEQAVVEACNCLKSDTIPKAGKTCDYCSYVDAVKKKTV
ncbi:MAG: PD-(D/E)XK nuclease family protein [Patescibacteria group bacterium]|jgi:CRISPR/Cas system-associated exonuclease Cas4 (RecB family)